MRPSARQLLGRQPNGFHPHGRAGARDQGRLLRSGARHPRRRGAREDYVELELAGAGAGTRSATTGSTPSRSPAPSRRSSNQRFGRSEDAVWQQAYVNLLVTADGGWCSGGLAAILRGTLGPVAAPVGAEEAGRAVGSARSPGVHGVRSTGPGSGIPTASRRRDGRVRGAGRVRIRLDRPGRRSRLGAGVATAGVLFWRDPLGPRAPGPPVSVRSARYFGTPCTPATGTPLAMLGFCTADWTLAPERSLHRLSRRSIAPHRLDGTG